MKQRTVCEKKGKGKDEEKRKIRMEERQAQES